MDKFEKKFWDILTALFVGAKLEGKSGFINLMKAKSSYFELVKKELYNEIESHTKDNLPFKEELYNKLYSFFHRYFSESGSIYYNYTPLYYNIYTKAYDSNSNESISIFDQDYEQVITDKQDTALFYKTQMLYYVKSDRIIKSLEIEIDGHRFFFDVAFMEYKKGNEKKSLIYDLSQVRDGRIEIQVSYKEGNKTTKIDKILKGIKKEKIVLSEEVLTKAIRVFEKQGNIDYFINKDAKKFLSEQLDMWIYQYMFKEETNFNFERYEQIRAFKKVAQHLIDFISQFENELVKIWNKPRFAINSNLVVTIDRLIEKGFDVSRLTNHQNYQAQQEEWRELGINEGDGLLKNSFLPIDTKYFSDLKEEIEKLFTEDEFDGLLIKSENYQALNTILPRFKGKIKTIYIDPPYNAPASEILYLNNYKRSSWLSMMENRLGTAKHFLSKDGVFECAIDKNEQESLGLLLDTIFPEYDKTCVSIVHNPRGIQGDNFSYNNEYTYFLAPSKGTIHSDKIDKVDYEYTQLRKWGGNP